MHSPAAERNAGSILEVLRRVLPAAGVVLEIASGTGQHAVYLASALTDLTWQPSEPDPVLRGAIATRVVEAALANLKAPLDLDVTRSPWPIAKADAMFCANMLHISPWPTAAALFAGAAQVLAVDARVVLYGPYRRHGAHTAPSNEAFDASLRARNPEWGVRDLEAVEEVAADAGFALVEAADMPANNFSLIWSRRSG